MYTAIMLFDVTKKKLVTFWKIQIAIYVFLLHYLNEECGTNFDGLLLEDFP